MSGVAKRRVGTPTLSEVGEIAILLFKASREKRNKRFYYSDKCQDFMEENCLERINTDCEDFREFTKDEFIAMKKAKSDEYNAQRRLERACRAFVD